MRKVERAGRWYCQRGGHPLETNLYVEPHSRRERCRACATEQRTKSRLRRKAAVVTRGDDLGALMSRQRPTEDDVAAALEAWSTGAAGEACRREGLTAGKVAALVGITENAAGLWLRGKTRPHRRFQAAATKLAMAVGAIGARASDSLDGDELYMIGGREGHNGPWHQCPPTTDAARATIPTDPYTGQPKHFGYWPAVGMVGLTRSKHLGEAHYRDDPRMPDLIARLKAERVAAMGSEGAHEMHVLHAARRLHETDMAQIDWYTTRGITPPCPAYIGDTCDSCADPNLER